MAQPTGALFPNLRRAYDHLPDTRSALGWLHADRGGRDAWGSCDVGMVMKFEWILVKPGVLALSGTPIQVRFGKNKIGMNGVFIIYERDLEHDWFIQLEHAKSWAIKRAKELIEIGIVDDLEG